MITNCTQYVQMSMRDADMYLQKISDGCKEVLINSENKKLPFGGKHIIIIGELLQMPPVS